MAFPDQVIAQGPEVFNFIPQRPPMVMIDTLISCADKRTCTSFKILPDNIFVKNGLFSEPGIIENIAQTAAAGLGFSISEKRKSNQIPIGVIGAIKDLKIYCLPETGEALNTEVKIVFEHMNASIIKGEVFAGTKMVADCEMKIFLL